MSRCINGATWADSPKAVGEQGVEVVFTSLPVPTDVEAVVTGPNGLIEGLKPDTAIFDMSTNSVAMVRKLKPSAVTLDLGLSDIDGFVLLDLLRHDPDTAKIPVR